MAISQRPSSAWLILILWSGLLGTAASLRAADDAALYGRRIVVPETMGKNLQASVADLKQTLARMTGKDFRSGTDQAGQAIVLLRSTAPQAPSKVVGQLKGLGREPFVIQAEGNTRLWLVANGEAGLCHAIYYYLEQLGARWYYPGDNWTIIPKRDNITLTFERLVKPAFVARTFFGSGGFGGILPNDPTKGLQTRWETWQRRNRFGGEFLLGGHSGEAFNAKHKKILEAHPEYLAMADGVRRPWSPIVKFCASNPDVVDLFVKDRIEAMRLQRRLDPEGPRSWAVSVEPSDGGGHCECPKCLALGSPSDRVFHVANVVARAIDREFPGAHVNLYAYHEHAAVPKIALEKNVYVMVIPYAFQRTDLSPEQLLTAWSQKVPRLSVYDYWSIPDWNQDLPTFDFVGKGPARLRGWHARHVDGFNAESTYSAGAMGPAWYIGGRLAWEPQREERRLLAEFYEQAFGPAAASMQRMLERWSAGFCFTSHELGLSFRDLDEAWGLAHKQPDVAARVGDYIRYVHYLRLRFRYVQTPARSPDRHAATLDLFRHMWNIYDSAMIHAFRLSQLLARDESKTNPDWLARYNLRDKQAPGWGEIKPLAAAALPELLADGLRNFQTQNFEQRRFTGKPQPLIPDVTLRKDTFSAVLIPSSTLELHVAATGGLRDLPLKIACEKVVRVRATNAAQKVVFDQLVETGADWRTTWSEVTIPLPEPGAYAVQLWSPRRTFRLAVPAGVPLTMPGFTNSQGLPTPRLYFFVPAQVQRLALYAAYTAAGPPRFYNPAGDQVKIETVDGGKLLLVHVPPGQSGQVWSLSHAKAPNEPLRFLNAPQAFAFFPDTLLVPADARK